MAAQPADFAALLGHEVLSYGQGRAHLRVTASNAQRNMHGSIHGGFLYSLADEAFALASNSRNAQAVATDTHMHYLKAVWPGDVLDVEACELQLGNKLARYQVTLRRDQTTVALFIGTVYRSAPAAT